MSPRALLLFPCWNPRLEELLLALTAPVAAVLLSIHPIALITHEKKTSAFSGPIRDSSQRVRCG